MIIHASLRLAAAAAALLLTSPVDAGPVDARLIDRQATWTAHVDLAALRHLWPDMVNAGDQDMADFAAVFGFDPRHEVNGVTAYGCADDRGILVLQGSEQMARSLATIHQRQHAPELQGAIVSEQLDHEGFEIHRIQVEGDALFAFVPPSTRRGEHILVIGQELEGLTDGIRVLRGDRASLASSTTEDDPPTLMLEATPGSFLFVESRGLPWLEDDESTSDVVRRTDRIALDIAGTEEHAAVRACVSTRNETDALTITGLLHGLVSVGRLAIGDDPSMAALMKLSLAVRIVPEGNDVIIEADIPIDLVEEAVEAASNHGVTWDLD